MSPRSHPRRGRVHLRRLSIALCAAALACTPSLSGVCTSSADCKSGESCSTDGICLRSETGDAGNGDAGNSDAGNSDAGKGDAGKGDAGNGDAGNSDAGTSDAGTSDAGTSDAGTSDAGTSDAGTSDAGTSDAGTTTGSIDILSPASGAYEKGTFHVSASAASSTPIQDVTFYLTNASNGAALGQVAGAQSGSTWAGDLTVSASAFGGNANLVAVMRRVSAADL